MVMALYRKMIVEGCELREKPGFFDTSFELIKFIQYLYSLRFRPVCVDCTEATHILIDKKMTEGDTALQRTPAPFSLFWLEWNTAPFLKSGRYPGSLTMHGAIVSVVPDGTENDIFVALSVEGAPDRSGTYAGRMITRWAVKRNTGERIFLSEWMEEQISTSEKGMAYATYTHQKDVTDNLAFSWNLMTMQLVWLLSVRNIKRVSVGIKLKEQRQLQGHGAHRLDYRILKISDKIVCGAGQRQTGSHRDLPLHLVMGHFSAYTAEKPLFGKYTGTFFIPAHTRGNQEHGIIRKGYRI